MNGLIALRRRWLTQPIYRLFKRLLPHMSSTEQEALEAGSVWWDQALLSGNPDWNQLLDLPHRALTAKEQAFLDGPVAVLCDRVNDWDLTHLDYDLSPEIWQFLKTQGFFGMIIPESYGGLGFSAQAHSQVVLKIASRSTSAGVTVMVPNSLGPAELLLHYGTEAQKNYYLPRLASGQEIPCFALTSPDAGSDAGSMPDSGIVCRREYQGKETLGIRVTWNKRYITLAPVASLLGLAFKLHDPDHILGPQTDIGITLALIPTHTPGVHIGRRHLPMNLVFQNGPTWGTDVFIPMDWVIGGVAQVGHGWRMLMECLAEGRGISLPALSTAANKSVSRICGAYSHIRRQFKLPIGKFEGIAEALARIAGNTYATEAVRSLTADLIDHGQQPAVLTAIAKYQLTERMRQVINDGMDIQGGKAICMGPNNLLARAYQAIPISITVEGANILTRTLIIFGQGVMRCHPYLLQEVKAAQNPEESAGLIAFDAAFFAHLRFTLRNALRSLWLGLTAARWQAVAIAEPQQRRLAQHISHLSANLALVSDMTLWVLGGEFKRREQLSGRLADMLSHLHIASCAIKQFRNQNQPVEDVPLLQWVGEDSLYKAQEACSDLLANFPQRWIGRLLRILIWPLGRPHAKPSDALALQLAALIYQPSACRDRLTQGIYLPSNPTEALARLDFALEQVVAAEAVEAKVKQAMREGKLPAEALELQWPAAVEQGIISELEYQQVLRAEQERQAVIQVDHFSSDFDTQPDQIPSSILKQQARTA